jgi:hypothetical protein
MSERTYSLIQPRDKDLILLCGHGNEKHGIYNPNALTFMRPDGTTGESFWIVCCEECYSKFLINNSTPDIRDEGIWQGNEPCFYKILS